MPVVDASVMVEFLALGDHEGAAKERLLGEQQALWAPELLDAEVGQALRRAVRKRAVKPDLAPRVLWELETLPVRRISHRGLVHYAWALRERVSFYDGLYVALAQLLEQPLLTFDARLARAGLDADVEVLAQA
jgi:predicted nucleic acid-binding protein